MSYYISQVLLNTARLLMDVRLGTATGGSTTTLVDTSCAETDSYFKGGTLWCLSGLNINSSYKITDWDLDNTFFTLPAATYAHSAGNLYAAAPDKYSKDELLAAYNLAALEVGKHVNGITISAGTGTLVYTLSGAGVRPIRVQTYPGTTVNEAVDHIYWKVSGTYLIFDPGTEPDTGTTIRIYYVSEPTPATVDSTYVDTSTPQDLLTWKTAFYAALQRARKVENNDPGAMEMVKMANEMCKMLDERYPARYPQSTPKLARWE